MNNEWIILKLTPKLCCLEWDIVRRWQIQVLQELPTIQLIQSLGANQMSLVFSLLTCKHSFNITTLSTSPKTITTHTLPVSDLHWASVVGRRGHAWRIGRNTAEPCWYRHRMSGWSGPYQSTWRRKSDEVNFFYILLCRTDQEFCAFCCLSVVYLWIKFADILSFPRHKAGLISWLTLFLQNLNTYTPP